MRSREELWNVINTASFAIDDLILYLDTHPYDMEAWAYYANYRNIREEAVMEYTTQFGPLTVDRVDVTNQWTWVSCPWPWEVEG